MDLFLALSIMGSVAVGVCLLLSHALGSHAAEPNSPRLYGPKVTTTRCPAHCTCGMCSEAYILAERDKFEAVKRTREYLALQATTREHLEKEYGFALGESTSRKHGEARFVGVGAHSLCGRFHSHSDRQCFESLYGPTRTWYDDPRYLS